MISFIKGIIAHKSFGNLVVEVNGIGYEVNVSSFCYNSIGEVGQEVKLPTYLLVREDELSLFGFESSFEKEVFLKLILVNGVGPKMAINILSGVSAQDLSFAIATQNAGILKGIKGVGAKIRERILLELKEKIDALSHLEEVDLKTHEQNESQVFSQVHSVLLDWGVGSAEAQSVLNRVFTTTDTVESLLAKCFKELGK